MLLHGLGSEFVDASDEREEGRDGAVEVGLGVCGCGGGEDGDEV